MGPVESPGAGADEPAGRGWAVRPLGPEENSLSSWRGPYCSVAEGPSSGLDFGEVRTLLLSWT